MNILPSSQYQRKARRRGQALVEFAFVVVMFIVLLCGIIEFGVYGQNVLKLANATREGARAAAVGKDTTTIKARVTKFAGSLPVTSPNGSIVLEVSSDGGDKYKDLTDSSATQNAAKADDYVRVTSTSTSKAVTGLFGGLFNRQFSQQVVMRREN